MVLSLRLPTGGVAATSRSCEGVLCYSSRSCSSTRSVSRQASQRVRCSASNGGKGTSQEPSAPFNIVITGSTKGIGLCLAKEFLSAGDSVVISSRSGDAVQNVVSDLGNDFGQEKVKGVTCNVSKASDVQNLANFAAKELGAVDFWINNAGTNAYAYKVLSDFDEGDLAQVIETNLLGTMLCCREAIRIMKDQPTDGHIFNMEGAGSNGQPTPRFAAYGATKRAISHFNQSLGAELKMQGIGNVGIHDLQPGMCATDLLMSGADDADGKFFINCLAEDPEVPARFLVPLIREIPNDSKPLFGMMGIQPKAVTYLTPAKAYSQIFRVVMKKKKGGSKKKGTSKPKAPPPDPFVYEILNLQQLQQRQDEFVCCRMCNTEVSHLNFDLPMVSIDATLSSIKQAIRGRHAGAVYEVILFKGYVRPECLLHDPDHSSLRDIGIKGSSGGSDEDLPTVTFYYDFPPQHSDDPLLTMMVGGAMDDVSDKRSTQASHADIQRGRKSPLGQGLQIAE